MTTAAPTRDPLLSRSRLGPSSRQRTKRNIVIGVIASLVVGGVIAAAVLLTQEDKEGGGDGQHDITEKEVLQNMTSAMNNAVDPCEDFYEYACGNWVKTHPIPGDATLWARSFSTIAELVQSQLKELLGSGTNTREGKFFSTCLNTNHLEERGFDSIRPILDTIIQSSSSSDWLHLSGHLLRHGVSTLLSVGVEVDVMDTANYMLSISQGGLGLPDRQYYLQSDYATIVHDYTRHIETMLGFLDFLHISDQAAHVVEFEKQLAQVSRTRADMRDPYSIYHNMSISALEADVPLGWETFFQNITFPETRVNATTKINVQVPEFVEALPNILKTTSKDTLQAYFLFHTMHSFSSSLPQRVRDETFKFFSKELSGQVEQTARWKQCISSTDGNLPDALGLSYQKRYFQEHDKSTALNMLHSIEDAFQQRLEANEWMDSETQTAAEGKLDQLQNNIGYPAHFDDYAGMGAFGDDFLQNTDMARTYAVLKEFSKLGKPVDRSEWQLSVPTVNAYYDPSLNVMVFPAGILQYPFFSSVMPYAVNMGGMGAVMGHELSHGFDDQGSQYDGTGLLRKWWTPESTARFVNRTECIEDQFDAYPIPGVPNTFVNGALTLGENIADLGGVITAYHALKSHQLNRSREQASLDFPPDFQAAFVTEERLLFTSWAQVWCENIMTSERRNRVTTDPHSPPEYRVRGPLTNVQEFAEAFQCAAGSSMNPPDSDRCVVW